VQGQGFRDRAPEFEAAGAVILGISFDSVSDQKKFADDQGFPYALLADPDKAVGKLYDAERQPGEKYAEHGIPRRISYLIDPQGVVHKAYDVENDGGDLAAHADAVLADIRAAS
jgi:peroxiredoxin Q/BCP